MTKLMVALMVTMVVTATPLAMAGQSGVGGAAASTRQAAAPAPEDS